MSPPVRKLSWPGKATRDQILDHEWIVTNGLGGYASGTVTGVITRRFHGLLIAALPNPYGRWMMLNDVAEQLRFRDGHVVPIGGEHTAHTDVRVHGAEYLSEFRIEWGLPIWTYEVEGITLEKRLVMPHGQNTVHVTYRVICGVCDVQLELRPGLHFRPHEGALDSLKGEPYILKAVADRYEFASSDQDLPPLRMAIYGAPAAFTFDRRYIEQLIYYTEEVRGYESRGDMWSPGYFSIHFTTETSVALIASTETWENINALPPDHSIPTELSRRQSLVARAHPKAQDDLGAELTLAADEFIITPAGRSGDVARARAGGDEVRTVIAGYHWFTDWGRDTMISLEGLTLTTGRWSEAGWILRTFAYYVQNGLIPNMFPEGEKEGLYHTADATLWFFHALNRYVEVTGDHATLSLILPKLIEIVRRHLEGTGFGIQVDPKDGLLRQGAPGYQLTWMDAKVDDWVVTPRRGKAVEINALWYNAIRLLQDWVENKPEAGISASELDAHAARAKESFNRRFWYPNGNCLYDIVDGEQGDDSACRPNQVLAISLKHPILEPSRWKPVLDVVTEKLLTPVGLRSLAPGEADYKSRYYGDLRSRDAAYHQGTVWAWLIGPFIDAWLKVHPDDRQRARQLLAGFSTHMEDGAIGTLSEIFDAEHPYSQRGCISQAWSVAEVLRCWVKTAE
jgi:predicted glycogen debranching enzyme